MVIDVSPVLQQIDGALDLYNVLRARAKTEDCSDLPYTETLEVVMRMQSTVARIAPSGSTYSAAFEDIKKRYGLLSVSASLNLLPPLLKALKADYQAGYINTLRELIHAELFSDFLEMADHLLGEAFKDPAAVLAGGVLEEHLRHLCAHHAIDTSHAGRPKKTEQMNTELGSAAAYSRLDQKSVTAWLDLRNKAAHGCYKDYEKQQVALMVQGIRDFITRVPAF